MQRQRLTNPTVIVAFRGGDGVPRSGKASGHEEQDCPDGAATFDGARLRDVSVRGIACEAVLSHLQQRGCLKCDTAPDVVAGYRCTYEGDADTGVGEQFRCSDKEGRAMRFTLEIPESPDGCDQASYSSKGVQYVARSIDGPSDADCAYSDSIAGQFLRVYATAPGCSSQAPCDVAAQVSCSLRGTGDPAIVNVTCRGPKGEVRFEALTPLSL